ncbi:MAG: response regulator transcription factor [Chloroflexota bacterium]
MITVLICDDQDIVREGLQLILETDTEIKVVGVASDGDQAIELTAKLKPHIVLMDLKMPILNGIHATREIRTRFPEIYVLVLTTYDNDEWVFDAIRAGASGYLLKDTPRERLIKAVKEITIGKTPVDPSIAGKLFEHVADSSFTPETTIFETLSEREKEVLKLIGVGMSNLEIADRLCLSEGTIRNYVTSIFNKLDVSGRTQAALLAVRNHLL